MENSKQEINELIDAYLSGKATPQQVAQLERAYSATMQQQHGVPIQQHQ